MGQPSSCATDVTACACATALCRAKFPSEGPGEVWRLWACSANSRVPIIFFAARCMACQQCRHLVGRVDCSLHIDSAPVRVHAVWLKLNDTCARCYPVPSHQQCACLVRRHLRHTHVCVNRAGPRFDRITMAHSSPATILFCCCAKPHSVTSRQHHQGGQVLNGAAALSIVQILGGF